MKYGSKAKKRKKKPNYEERKDKFIDDNNDWHECISHFSPQLILLSLRMHSPWLNL